MRLDQTNARLDNLIATVGGVTRGHEARLSGLEDRVARVERTLKRRRPSPGPRRK